MSEPLAEHLNPAEIEQWAEGLLPAARVLHLSDCATCLETAERERRFFRDLVQLERLEPSADFADRVMAEIKIPTPSGRHERQ